MGTSSRYKGHNKSPLLPADFNDDENSGSQDSFDEPTGGEENPNNENDSTESETDQQEYSSWRQAKGTMTKYVKGKGGTNDKKNVLSSYVRAHGGSHNAARSARSAIKTTINISKFFGSISEKGITKVLEEHQISIKNKKPKEILNDIVNLLAPAPNLNEEAVARKALIITMSIIYEKFDNENKDISLLDSLNANISEILIAKYIEVYIYERLIQEMGYRIETESENSKAAAKIEQELKEYIGTKVSTTLANKPLSVINTQTRNVNVLVEGLYQQCYKVLEDQL